MDLSQKKDPMNMEHNNWSHDRGEWSHDYLQGGNVMSPGRIIAKFLEENGHMTSKGGGGGEMTT